MRLPGRGEAAAGHVAALPAGRPGGPRPVLVAAGGRRRGRGLRRRGRPARRDRRVDREAPALGRPGGDVPFGWAGLQLPDGAGRTFAAGDLRVHHRVPRRGRQVRGDAGRPEVRPDGGSAVRRRPARDRDRAAGARPAAEDDLPPRRADRRPGGDQLVPDLLGRARRRRQGDAVRDGRRRAVRRVPQAPREPDRAALPQGAVRGPLRPVESLVDRLPVASATRGYRSVRFAKRFLSFAGLPEETAFRRSYTMYDQAELLSLLEPRPGPRRSTTSSPSTRTPTTTSRSTTSSTACAWPTRGCSCRG